jgi:hypothetical protein
LREGDVTQVNVNAFDFCRKPDARPARVVALTNTAVILADLANPPGGFTDAEYRAFGMTMDTLVHPLNTAVFGTPSDIDGNGRVAILFTKAVNELTPFGSTGGIVLGFFYSRDLLPRESSSGGCAGSNVGELFYLMVPDTGGVVSDRRSKSFVERLAVGTIAHEFQHLINSSRRLYVNNSPSPNEELWLNEGLSHIAEELLFYRVSQLTPRQNLGASALQTGTGAREAFDTHGRGNLTRYQQYLRAPDLNSPISTQDFLATRGATWSYLRFLADRSGTTDGDLWYRIVNSQLTGLQNLDRALGGATSGLTALGLLRDWSASVLVDDHVPQTEVAFQQPSWDFVTGMPEVGLSSGVALGTLTNGLMQASSLRAGGSAYTRFGVPENQEALIRVTGASGRPISPGIRLTIVRTR